MLLISFIAEFFFRKDTLENKDARRLKKWKKKRKGICKQFPSVLSDKESPQGNCAHF